MRTPPMDAEVLVIGGGPAGAVAARTLAAAGVDTLVIDRAEFPRNKPCGGCVSTRARTRFGWLDDALRAIDVHEVSRLHLEGPAGATLALRSPRSCVLLVRRVEFDQALLTAATRAGARVESGFEVTQADVGEHGHVVVRARDGRTRAAPCAIAADGVHSVMAKRLGVNPRWPRSRIAIDMMEETPAATLRAVEPDVLWIAYAYGGLDGYGYVFPKTHHVNVGVGCLLSHFDAKVDARPYAMQQQFVETLVERGVLDGASDPAHFTPFLIPVGGPLTRTWHRSVVFAGDAGGFVNPITAEGIYYAMVSGELAGRAVADYRHVGARDAVGRAYERAWQAELGTELRDATLLQRYLFSSHARMARVIRGAGRLPQLTSAVLEFMRGDRTYARLRRHMLLRFPLTALTLARERFRLEMNAAMTS